MNLAKSSCLILGLILSIFQLQSQSVNALDLPKVFILGDHVDEYEQLYMRNANLLEVCDNDMNLAFNSWMHMVERMDDYSQELGIDLKGLKLWLNILWEKDGHIKHLAYFKKPDSKSLEYSSLTEFFTNFIESYRLPIEADQSFTHYGSAAFPTLSDRLASKNRQN